MDHVGFLAGSVGDVAYIADSVLPCKGLLFAAGMPAPGLRVGAPRPSFSGASVDVVTAVRGAVERLRDQGASIVPLESHPLTKTSSLPTPRVCAWPRAS